MAKENEMTTTPAPPEVKERLTEHQAIIERLAAIGMSEEVLRRLVADESAKVIDASVAEAIENARKTMEVRAVNRTEVTLNERRLGRPLMDKEQLGEWTRCAIARCIGRHDMGVPKSDLDVDGLITQALTPTTGSAGGYLLPDEFVAEVAKKADEPAIIWPILNKQPVKRRHVVMPAVTSYITPSKGTAANVNSATTATEITATEAVWTELEWDCEDFDARMPLKLDLVEESPINVYDELVAMCVDGYSIHHEYLPLLGRGHTTYKEPLGLLDSAAGITAVAISAAPTVANVLNFASNLPPRYRRVASIVMGSQTLFKVIAALAENVRAASFLATYLPPFKESEHLTEGKMLGGDFSRYHVKFIRLLQIVTSIAAERKTQEIVITETWTGRPTITDAFRIGTGVTYA